MTPWDYGQRSRFGRFILGHVSDARVLRIAPDASTVRHMQDLLAGWGEEVGRLLAGRGMTLSELARQVDVEPSTISRIVAGRLNPNDELKWKIAGVLGERMDVLWAWPRIVPPSPNRAAS